MPTPIRIDFQGMPAQPNLRQAIAQYLSEMESLFGRITGGRIVVKAPGNHHRSGGLYEVHIQLRLPNSPDITVARTASADRRYADIRFAIAETFKRARRQLHGRIGRLKGQVRLHERGALATA
jgi:ribosome-associated translation inhibitor RaiA